jgi:predicted O-methyltransferase YrrM
VPADKSARPPRKPAADRDFDIAFAEAAEIGGWLTRDQAFVLWSEAKLVPAGGRIVEIGSHRGRSTVILGGAAPNSTVVAIDPFVGGAMFGGPATKHIFLANIADAGLTDRIDLRQAKSTDLRPQWDQPIDLLYIDGKHDFWTLSDDLRWTAHLDAGQHVLIHDAFSSVGVTLGLLRHVLPSRRLRYLDRTGSLARFEVVAPAYADRLRLLAEMPWWIRNLGIKVLLRLKLFPIARLVGHHDTADPY